MAIETSILIDKHFEQLKKLAAKIDEDFDADAIHDFRVSFKKLRALFRMLAIARNHDHLLRMPKAMKRCYSILGEIRDAQLLKQQMEAMVKGSRAALLAPYFAQLQKQNDTAQQEWKEADAGDCIRDAHEKAMKAKHRKITTTLFKNFLHLKLQAIYSIINAGKFTDEHIHFTRKSLKDIHYNIQFFTGDAYGGLLADTWKKLDRAYFEQLLDELGRFQDKCTAIRLQQAVCVNNLPAACRILLQEISVSWRQEKQAMKLDLVKKLKDTFGPGWISA